MIKVCFFLMLPFSLLGQSPMEGPWIFECGASSNSRYRDRTILNFRYVSPRFRWTQSEWSAEEETHPEDFKKSRLMLEVLYAPPREVLATSVNVQHRILKYKKLSVEAYGGVKFFFISPKDMGMNCTDSSSSTSHSIKIKETKKNAKEICKSLETDMPGNPVQGTSCELKSIF